MKRLTQMLFLIIISIIPFVSVNAFEISCDEGIHEFGDYFTCRLNGADINATYDTLSGTINNNEYVSCLRYTDGVGLVNQNTTNNQVISYTGKPTSTTISTLRCQVIKKALENQKVQILINDFKFHTNLQSSAVSEEIIRSNYINVAKYVEKTTSSSTKPRDTSNSDSRLKALTDDNLNITFSGFITEYNTEVLYEVEKLDLKIYPFNSDADVRIVGSQNLNIGLNVIDIYVTSPSGTSRTCYTLNVTRLNEGENIYYPESDASLKNLTVTGYALDFKPEVFEYTIHLDNQTNKVEVNATPNVDTSTINISDTNNLTNGSAISVTVKSADLSNETKYKILITKDPPKKDYTSYIILGVLGVLGIIVIIMIITTNKKNKKDPLLRIKKEKRKINKGKKIDQTVIPEAQNLPNSISNSVNQIENNTVPNVINANNVNVIKPIPVTAQATDSNLNNVNTNTNSLDLNVSARAMPQIARENPATINQPTQALELPGEVQGATPVSQQTVPSPPQPPQNPNMVSGNETTNSNDGMIDLED